MTHSNPVYRHARFMLMAVEPVHIGTGGQRLGRVDNSIAREPGTRLPKIPGTSLSGAIRQYAAVRYENRRCAGSGQDQASKKGHCQNPKCPVCYTFGYLKGQDGGQSGTVSIGDARLLLFPVYSLAGPVWVTCPAVLREFDVEKADPGDTACLPESLGNHRNLNIGWLMLEKAAEAFIWPDAIKGLPSPITDRAILISDKLFSQVVNSNLEVRTSVSIDPETGAAKPGALFTYEAIPRTAILWSEVIEDDFRRGSDQTDHIPDWPITSSKKDTPFPDGETWQSPLDVVQSGLKLAEHLGIGGMGTRGFGRIRLLHKEERS